MEMLLALAIRLEEHIMSDPERGDRTRIWFWTMLSNLELDDMIDSRFDANHVENAIQKLLNREYGRDGKGGLFRIKHCKYDLRNVEIWYAWNGITGITENPSGAEPSILWANNKKYMTLMSVEQLGLTIEAYTYPNEFLGCIGKEELSPGVLISQQEHEHFGLSYRTLVGNDERGNDYAYKVHLVYNCLASPTEENHASTSDSPDISPFSWEIDTTPVEVENRQSTSKLTFSSSDMNKAGMANVLRGIEDALYGTPKTSAYLPTVSQVMDLIEFHSTLRDSNGNAITDSSGNKMLSKVYE